MKTALYPRLAWDGLRKNKRLFTPYLLTCICMVMMFYILSFLGSPETCALLPRGSNSTGLILNLGSFVIFVFSAIFLYYTNSFLVRRREREFGLYNVLGMNKRNLARIVTWESLITAALSLVLGLALGIVLSKLAELGLVNMLGGDINYRIRIDADSLTRALGLYAIIFAVIWLSTVVRVGRSSAVALLRSESVGEKPPKANWLLGLAGVVILAAAYYLAVSITNPLDAIVWFFVAVILVIIGTYLLLVAGSVLLCRVLQKNKKYYYRPEHFVSVSSMAYRMKRNGAGLASVCIIATMILLFLVPLFRRGGRREYALPERYKHHSRRGDAGADHGRQYRALPPCHRRLYVRAGRSAEGRAELPLYQYQRSFLRRHGAVLVFAGGRLGLIFIFGAS